MGLKKVASSGAVNLSKDVRQTVDPPSVVINAPAQLEFKYLALRLFGVTAFTAEKQIAAVHEAAATLPESDDVDWTVEDARRILAAVGSVPATTHVTVSPVEGEGMLTLRAVLPGTPGAEKLKYYKRQTRISLLAVLRDAGMTVPKGMAMDVPVKLVDDKGALALALYLRRGKMREVVQTAAEETAAANEE